MIFRVEPVVCVNRWPEKPILHLATTERVRWAGRMAAAFPGRLKVAACADWVEGGFRVLWTMPKSSFGVEIEQPAGESTLDDAAVRDRLGVILREWKADLIYKEMLREKGKLEEEK